MSPKRKQNRHTDIDQLIEEDVPVCMKASALFHKMFHGVLDPERVCVESAGIVLPDTEPKTRILIILAAVNEEDFPRVRKAGHEAVGNIMTEIYGVSKDEITH